MEPLHHCFFVQKSMYQGTDAHLSRACNLLWNEAWPLGLNPKLVAVMSRGLLVVLALVVVWMARTERSVSAQATASPWRIPAAFLFDGPVDTRWFAIAGQLTLAFLVRCPAIVLLYAASRDALLVPGYALSPELAAVLGPFQVVLAVLILAQAALPCVGALLAGTWLFVATHGALAGVDAWPLAAVAGLYLSAPWQSHELPVLAPSPQVRRLFRVAVGLGWIASGHRDLFAYESTALLLEGVPRLADDPLTRLLMMGHSAGFARETWIAAVGALQLAGGVLIAGGVFTRAVALVGSAILVGGLALDSGAHAIGRLVPLAALLALVAFERHHAELGAHEVGRSLRERAITVLSLAALAATAVVPALYLLSTIDRRGLF